jgi:hypothetical protein
MNFIKRPRFDGKERAKVDLDLFGDEATDGLSRSNPQWLGDRGRGSGYKEGLGPTYHTFIPQP